MLSFFGACGVCGRGYGTQFLVLCVYVVVIEILCLYVDGFWCGSGVAFVFVRFWFVLGFIV